MTASEAARDAQHRLTHILGKHKDIWSERERDDIRAVYDDLRVVMDASGQQVRELDDADREQIDEDIREARG